MKREMWTEETRLIAKCGLDGKILLKWLLEKQSVKERTEFNGSG